MLFLKSLLSFNFKYLKMVDFGNSYFFATFLIELLPPFASSTAAVSVSGHNFLLFIPVLLRGTEKFKQNGWSDFINTFVYLWTVHRYTHYVVHRYKFRHKNKTDIILRLKQIYTPGKGTN
ncbi:hypothetical protein WA026_001139 [Henosepilachna vigintioctopunctata]|uniref:Uncharacterized protein n=1 Tax=Henosepilachna vigintioctopunctata TaxID=420089 RepID=A0AAW1UQ85_9CUCU